MNSVDSSVEFVDNYFVYISSIRLIKACVNSYSWQVYIILCRMKNLKSGNSPFDLPAGLPHTSEFASQGLQTKLELRKFSALVQGVERHEHALTLHRPNSLITPAPLPVSVHLFFTVEGRVSFGKVFSCN
jgi:hypothetical protein